MEMLSWVNMYKMTYVLVLAAALSAVDALLGEGVANALQSTAFAELAADEVVDAILGLVDGLDAGDLGLVESVCLSIDVSQSWNEHMQRNDLSVATSPRLYANSPLVA